MEKPNNLLMDRKILRDLYGQNVSHPSYRVWRKQVTVSFHLNHHWPLKLNMIFLIATSPFLRVIQFLLTNYSFKQGTSKAVSFEEGL